MAIGKRSLGIKRTIRRFSFTLIFVSSLSYKLLVVCDDESNFGGVPFDIWEDFAFIFVLIYSSPPLFLLCLLSTIISLLASTEIVAAMNGFEIPWRLSMLAIREYNVFAGLVQEEMNKQALDEGGDNIGFGLVWESLVIISLYLNFMGNKFHPSKLKQNRIKLVVGLGMVCLTLYAFLGAFIFQPNRPCNSTTARPYTANKSRTLLFQVGREIFHGYQQDKKLREQLKTIGSDVHWHPAIASGKPNVVIILLESLRKDMMPFDPNSNWAHKWFRNDTRVPVTPFYTKFISDKKHTVFWPNLQSASGNTHKSMLSLFCSQYAMPIEMTREHNKKWHHKCLPEILMNQGYNTKLFKGMTRNFDHMQELVQRMGFLDIYGKEDIIGDQPKEEQNSFEDQYNSGWGSLEDQPLLAPILDWVDEQVQNQVPFLMTYMTSVTHFPYPIPKNNWTTQLFSDHRNLNEWLNCVAYTDEFLKQLFRELLDKRQSLANNTLFVVLGDHGTDLLDYGRRTIFEVTQQIAFEVSLSFHTRNHEMTRRLNTARPHVNGNWTTLDVAPTILELFNIPVLNPFEDSIQKKRASLQLESFGREKSSHKLIMDGRAMFQSSGSRLTLSIANPGEGLVLKDGNLILVQIKNICHLYDILRDPEQRNPMTTRNCMDLMDKGKHIDNSLWQWARLAVPFISAIRSDLEDEFHTGIRNPNGIVFKLLTLDTLLQSQ
jgi:glucan phosphoethanolaminetransferase (alkaline phosphatase superfamily)